MAASPDGCLLGLAPGALPPALFTDNFVFGWVALTVFSVGSLVALAGLWWRPFSYAAVPLPGLRDKPRSRSVAG